MSTTAATCPACEMLRGIVQCNRCRRERPNEQTLRRAAMAADVRAGMTPAQAEAKHGATRRVVIG